MDVSAVTRLLYCAGPLEEDSWSPVSSPGPDPVQRHSRGVHLAASQLRKVQCMTPRHCAALCGNVCELQKLPDMFSVRPQQIFLCKVQLVHAVAPE